MPLDDLVKSTKKGARGKKPRSRLTRPQLANNNENQRKKELTQNIARRSSQKRTNQVDKMRGIEHTNPPKSRNTSRGSVRPRASPNKRADTRRGRSIRPRTQRPAQNQNQNQNQNKNATAFKISFVNNRNSNSSSNSNGNTNNDARRTSRLRRPTTRNAVVARSFKNTSTRLVRTRANILKRVNSSNANTNSRATTSPATPQRRISARTTSLNARSPGRRVARRKVAGTTNGNANTNSGNKLTLNERFTQKVKAAKKAAGGGTRQRIRKL